MDLDVWVDGRKGREWGHVVGSFLYQGQECEHPKGTW